MIPLPQSFPYKQCDRIILENNTLHVLCLLRKIKVDLKNMRIIDQWKPDLGDVYNFSLDENYLYFGPFVVSRSNRYHIATLIDDQMSEIHFITNDSNFVYLSSNDNPYATVWEKKTWELHQKLFMEDKMTHVPCLTQNEDYVCIAGKNIINVYQKDGWKLVHSKNFALKEIFNLIAF